MNQIRHDILSAVKVILWVAASCVVMFVGLLLYSGALWNGVPLAYVNQQPAKPMSQELIEYCKDKERAAGTLNYIPKPPCLYRMGN